MPRQVCSGATLRCSLGSNSSVLTVQPHNRVIATNPAANIHDNKPGVNFQPFGACASVGLCVPVTPNPWKLGGKPVKIGSGGILTLTEADTLICQVGGVIKVIDPGQSCVRIEQDAKSVEIPTVKANDVRSARQPIHKKVGSWLGKGAKRLWKGLKKVGSAVWTGVKWVGRQLWSKLKGIFQRAIGWIKQLPTRIGRLLLNIWQGVKTLNPWSLKWWQSLGQASNWKGVLKWLGINLINLLEIAGVGEIYETLADFIKFNTRPLTGEEIAKAKIVFGRAINYDLVRVDEAALLGPSWTNRPYTSFHTINSWGKMDDHTLIHELGHVWQYEQVGAIYMPQAIHAQNTKQGYDYGGVNGLKNAKSKGFSSFNREQQPQILQDYYALKNGQRPSRQAHGATSADLSLYEHFVREVRR
ncbi:PAAR-like protein [Coleofasciculus chthonoplastes]|uniref:PAAR-like protein n=1 Tax=Coleofasciculus chthonoplastes TaxID=64178 RepID=UPI0032FC6A67